MQYAKSALSGALSVCLVTATYGECVHVGGGVVTNIGVISPDRTLGTATGALKGAVGVQILGQGPGPDGTTVFTVHHYWVTDEGDTILVAQAQLTAFPVAPGLFAVVSYPVSITGGTGKFAGATGHLTAIGEADFNSGKIGLRYSGRVCFADGEEH